MSSSKGGEGFYVAAAGNKGSSSSKRGGAGGGGGGRPATRKQLAMALESATNEFNDALGSVLSALEEAGVPANRIEALKSDADAGNPTDVLEKCQEFTRCYPYMDSSGLIYLIADAWEALCAKNGAAKAVAQKKFNVLMADPKADTDALNAAEAAKDELVGICTQTNLRLYKIRALKALHEEKQKDAETQPPPAAQHPSEEGLKALHEEKQKDVEQPPPAAQHPSEEGLKALKEEEKQKDGEQPPPASQQNSEEGESQ